MDRQLTLNGKRFLAAVLYLHHEARTKGKRLRLWQVLKACGDREIARLQVRIYVK